MITHDSTFETLASAPVKQTDIVVVKKTETQSGYFDSTPSWTSSDVLMSVSIDSVGQFLGAATKKAVVKLLGVIDTAVVGELYQVRTGIYDADLDAFNYISQGYFIVDNIEFDYEAGSTTVTMYDHMWTAKNTDYKSIAGSSGFVFPATIQELATQMAAMIGVELTSNFITLPNFDYTILVDPYLNISNATVQSVIQEIAAATGTTARISDTELVFTPYTLNREAVS